MAKRSTKPTRAEAIAALQFVLQHATTVTQHGMQNERPDVQANSAKIVAGCLNRAARSLGATLPEGYVLVRGCEKGSPLAILKMSEPQGTL